MMKAIDTEYNGNYFRSRIEARWAVFFTALGIEYRYEPEGYDLGNGIWYLPDFWLPKQKIWIEIKGVEPSPEEEEKAGALSRQSGKMVYILWGDIPHPEILDGYYRPDPESGYAFFPDGGYDTQYWWCECSDCGTVGLEFNGRSDRLSCKESYWLALKRENQLWRAFVDKDQLTDRHFHTGCPRHGGNLDKGYAYDAPRIIAAYDMARKARFGR